MDTGEINKDLDPIVHKIKLPRCPNGQRRNKKSGKCTKNLTKKTVTKKTVTKKTVTKKTVTKPVKDLKTKKKRCPNGSRRNKKTGNCESTKTKKKFDLKLKGPGNVALPTIKHKIHKMDIKPKEKSVKTSKNDLISEFLKILKDGKLIIFDFRSKKGEEIISEGKFRKIMGDVNNFREFQRKWGKISNDYEWSILDDDGENTTDQSDYAFHILEGKLLK